MGNIEQRLQVLEGQFRRARRMNRALAFLLVAVFCIAAAQSTTPSASGQKTPEAAPQSIEKLRNDRVPPVGNRLRTVEADQFVLFDQLGRSRAKLVVNNDGPALSMFDEEGQKKLELSQTINGSALHLLGSNESPVASLQVIGNGADAHLEIRSSQGSSLTKSSGVSVTDRDENQRLLLALINGNFPVLGISQSGQNGPSSVEITASDDGSRRLKMHDEDGHSLFTVSSATDTATTLNMRHPDHERSLQISTGASPTIAFFAPANGTDDLLPLLELGLKRDCKPYIRIVDSDGSPVFTAPTE